LSFPVEMKRSPLCLFPAGVERSPLCHSRPEWNGALSVIPGRSVSGGEGNPELNRKNMNKEHNYYIYILASKRNGTLYIGVSNSLFRRSFQHKLKYDKNSFTAKYNVDKLVYYEIYKYIGDAIKREKQLKKWNRNWKLKLIEKENSGWRDVFEDMN